MTTNTIMQIYNALAKIWSYKIGETYIGLQANISVAKDRFTIDDVDLKILKHDLYKDATINDGYVYTISLNEHQYINLKIIFYSGISTKNIIFVTNQFAEDSILDMYVYTNQDFFLFNIDANDYEDAIDNTIKYFVQLFQSIFRCIGNNTTNSDMAAIFIDGTMNWSTSKITSDLFIVLAAIFVGGAMNWSASKIAEYLIEHGFLEYYDKTTLINTIQYVRNIQQPNSPIINMDDTSSLKMHFFHAFEKLISYDSIMHNLEKLKDGDSR